MTGCEQLIEPTYSVIRKVVICKKVGNHCSSEKDEHNKKLEKDQVRDVSHVTLNTD